MANYPGRIIQEGEADQSVVRQIERQLAARGYNRAESGTYDPALTSLVRLFQAQHVDALGRPLKRDGQVGPLSWGALFEAPAGGGLLDRIIAVAASQIGVMEVPPGSNAGPRVEQFLASVNCPKGSPWCMAFVHWCIAAAAAPGACPAPKSAGVLDVLAKVRNSAPARFISKAQAIADPASIRPGAVFINDYGHGHGHTGFVEAVVGGGLTTIEGNTNNSTGSREGVGVFRLTRRSITDDELVGFIDFG